MAARKLEIQVIGDATSAGHMFSKVRSEADDTESKMSKWGKTVAAAVGVAFAADKVIDWGRTLISAAEDAQKVTRQTEAVIESMGAETWTTADAIAGLAEQISLKTGLDDEMIQSGENVLLTFGNITDAAGEGNDVFARATKVATDMSVALGQDLQSSVTQVGKALNDPLAGLSALSRVGVQFTDDQKNMITWLTAAGDTLGAQKIILGELERQFGGSAEAQATASDKLRVAWDNIQEQLGTILLPLFEKVVTWMAETLPQAIDTSITWIKAHQTEVEALAVSVGVVLAGAFGLWAKAATEAAVKTVVALAPWILAALVVGALAYGLYYAYENWGWFRTGVDGAVDVVQAAIPYVQTLTGWVNTLGDALGIFGAMSGGAFGVLGGLSSGSGVSPGPGQVGRTVPKLAEGGIVTRPTLAVVGEAGPEVIMPLGGRGSFFSGPRTNKLIMNVHIEGPVISERSFEDIMTDAHAKALRHFHAVNN